MINLQKLHDFATRLQQAHDEAMKRGDAAASKQYGQLIDEVGQKVQEAQGAQQAQQPAPGAKVNVVGGPQPMAQDVSQSMSGPTVASSDVWHQMSKPDPMQQMINGVPKAPDPKYTGPAGQPPDVAREAIQEAGGSWMNSLFSGAASPAALATYNPASAMQPENKAFGDNPVIGAYKNVAGPVWKMLNENVTGPIFNDSYKDMAMKNQVRTVNPATVAQQNDDYEVNGEPGQLAGDLTGSQFDPHTEETTASKLAAPQQKDRYEELLKGMGKSPAEMNWVDAVGLLLGGNNYLKFKAEQVRDYNNNKMQLGMSAAHAQAAREGRVDNTAYQQQKLAVEYAKNLSDERHHEAATEQNATNDLVKALGSSYSPDTLMKNPVVATEAARQKARRDALLEKQQTTVEKGK